MERLDRVSPREFTVKNQPFAEIVELSVKSSLATFGKYFEAQASVLFLRGVKRACELSPLLGGSQTSVELGLLDIEAISRMDRIVQQAARYFEDEVVKMQELGAVDTARAYAEMYRTLADYIPQT